MFEYVLWTETEIPYTDPSTGEPQIDMVWVDESVSRLEALNAIRLGWKNRVDVVDITHARRRMISAEWTGNRLVRIQPIPDNIEELPF